MAWHLKNRQLERKLDDSSDPSFPSFSEKLNHTMTNQRRKTFSSIDIRHTYSDGVRITGRVWLRFSRSDIERDAAA